VGQEINGQVEAKATASSLGELAPRRATPERGGARPNRLPQQGAQATFGADGGMLNSVCSNDPSIRFSGI
jgi:hypothetical protein